MNNKITESTKCFIEFEKKNCEITRPSDECIKYIECIRESNDWSNELLDVITEEFC